MLMRNFLRDQELLQQAMGDPLDTSNPVYSSAVKESMLALIVEATEVLNEISWKPWKPRAQPIDRDRLLTELIDVLQFWGNAVNAAGFAEEDIARCYAEKLGICYQRIKDKVVTQALSNQPE